MSRYHPDWNIEPIFKAASHWRKNALEAKKSVMTNESIWTDENLDLLHKYFVENLDYGEGDFISKLERFINEKIC